MPIAMPCPARREELVSFKFFGVWFTNQYRIMVIERLTKAFKLELRKPTLSMTSRASYVHEPRCPSIGPFLLVTTYNSIINIRICHMRNVLTHFLISWFMIERWPPIHKNKPAVAAKKNSLLMLLNLKDATSFTLHSNQSTIPEQH